MLVTFGIEVGTLNPNEFFMQKYPLVPFFGNKIQVPTTIFISIIDIYVFDFLTQNDSDRKEHNERPSASQVGFTSIRQ